MPVIQHLMGLTIGKKCSLIRRYCYIELYVFLFAFIWKIAEVISLVSQLVASWLDHLTAGQIGSLDYLGNMPRWSLFFWALAIPCLHLCQGHCHGKGSLGSSSSPKSTGLPHLDHPQKCSHLLFLPVKPRKNLYS